MDGHTLDTAGGVWEVLQVAKRGSRSGQLHRRGKNVFGALICELPGGKGKDEVIFERWDDGTECLMCRIVPVQWQIQAKSYRCAVGVGMGEQGGMRGWEWWVPSS